MGCELILLAGWTGLKLQIFYSLKQNVHMYAAAATATNMLLVCILYEQEMCAFRVYDSVVKHLSNSFPLQITVSGNIHQVYNG